MGAPYEITVLASQERWNSPLGDTLRAILTAPVEGINNAEPMYDVMRILPAQFDGLLAKSRNVLNVNTGPDYAEPVMGAQYDIYAAPQIVVSLVGPDVETLTAYVSEHRAELQQIFEITERDRSLALNSRFGENEIERQIEETFGFTMDLTKGYKVRNTAKDFMWISFEWPTASQGVIIYSSPYDGQADFEIDSLLARRNRFVSLIPGENPGSHMITLGEYVPEVEYRRINGRFWAQMRGFWDVHNDFMGGPFVSYSTLDVENRRVVTIDLYVYSPDKPKRNFLRQLEHLIYSVKFPGDDAAEE